jgi:hypothetical protein
MKPYPPAMPMPQPAPAASKAPQVKTPAMPQASPMARPPVAQTQRVVPSVPTGRGMVRTDTHNASNQVPHHAKHKGRGC